MPYEAQRVLCKMYAARGQMQRQTKATTKCKASARRVLFERDGYSYKMQ